MKKQILTISVLIFFVLTGFSQTKHFKFKIKNKKELKELSKIISIDNYKDNTVWAYANASEFSEFEKLGYNYKELKKNTAGPKSFSMATSIDEMSDWNKYPTHDVYLAMMTKWSSDYPKICKLVNIGTSKEGRNIVALKISDNVNQSEAEPDFLYTSTMHGDETTGYLLMLRYIDFLLTNYGKDENITNYINNIEIFINPLANPDGTYAGGDNTVASAQRELSGGTDPNRDFPDAETGEKTNYRQETQAMINFANTYNFVLSANFHGGDEVVNIPWDVWSSSRSHADVNWYKRVGEDYVKSARTENSSYLSEVTPSGVTIGSDWYYISGGRQDYMNYYKNCREITVELSTVKIIPASRLEEFWKYNKTSLINYMAESLYGIRGIVTDNTGKALQATITISGHDKDNSQVVTAYENGDYHRFIEPGTYNLTFSTSGYDDITVTGVSVTDKNTTFVDVVFGGTLADINLQGKIFDNDDNIIEDVEISLSNSKNNYTAKTDSQGNYSFTGISAGTYKVSVSKDGYRTALYDESFAKNKSFNIKLDKYVNISGEIIAAQTGEPIENAEIKFLNSSLSELTSNTSGEYQITGLIAGTYTIGIEKLGFSTSEQEITISNDITDNNFQLFASKGESFEAEIPSEYTFTGTVNWARSTDKVLDGTYSMKSGKIDNLSESKMQLKTTIPEGKISFYKKVSSEATYDFMNFYIDGEQKAAWSGEDDWSQESYSVSAGEHTFIWEYKKDDYTSKGSDCAWVDYIELPSETPTKYTADFTITNQTAPVENATIKIIGYGEQKTDSQGKASFTGLYATTSAGLYFEISSDVHQTYDSRIKITGNETIEIDLQGAGVSEIKKDKIKIYPNPSSGNFSIRSSLRIEKIEVYDILGQFKTVFYDNNHIFIENKGLYLLKIYTEEGIKIRKIMIADSCLF